MKIDKIGFDDLAHKMDVSFSKVSVYSKKRTINSLYNSENVFLISEDELKDIYSKTKINPDRIACSIDGQKITLRSGGEKYSSRPEKGEKFDAEKGIMVCLLKMAGISVTDVLKLSEKLKNNKSCGKGIKCDKTKKKV